MLTHAPPTLRHRRCAAVRCDGRTETSPSTVRAAAGQLPCKQGPRAQCQCYVAADAAKEARAAIRDCGGYSVQHPCPLIPRLTHALCVVSSQRKSPYKRQRVDDAATTQSGTGSGSGSGAAAAGDTDTAGTYRMTASDWLAGGTGVRTATAMPTAAATTPMVGAQHGATTASLADAASLAAAPALGHSAGQTAAAPAPMPQASHPRPSHVAPQAVSSTALPPPLQQQQQQQRTSPGKHPRHAQPSSASCAPSAAGPATAAAAVAAPHSSGAAVPAVSPASAAVVPAAASGSHGMTAAQRATIQRNKELARQRLAKQQPGDQQQQQPAQPKQLQQAQHRQPQPQPQQQHNQRLQPQRGHPHPRTPASTRGAASSAIYGAPATPYGPHTTATPAAAVAGGSGRGPGGGGTPGFPAGPTTGHKPKPPRLVGGVPQCHLPSGAVAGAPHGVQGGRGPSGTKYTYAPRSLAANGIYE